jgi:hypothetical protein
MNMPARVAERLSAGLKRCQPILADSARRKVTKSASKRLKIKREKEDGEGGEEAVTPVVEPDAAPRVEV